MVKVKKLNRPYRCYQFTVAKLTKRNKICYNTEKEAELAKKYWKQRFPDQKEMRIYYCIDCNHWHLTSKEIGY